MASISEPENMYARLTVDGSLRTIEFRLRLTGGGIKYTPTTQIYWDKSTCRWSEDQSVLNNESRGQSGTLGNEDLPGRADMLGPEDFPKIELGPDDFPKFE